MKRRRKLRIGRIAVVLLVPAVLICGCIFAGKKLFGKMASQPEEVAAQEETSLVTIGDKAEATRTINLDNQCGQAIVSFKVKTATAAGYGENLLSGSRIKNKSTAQWYFSPESGTDYYVEIILANYASFTLHIIPFTEFSGLVTINYKTSDGIGYLTYTGKGTDTSVSTYSKEVEWNAAQTAAAQQDTESQSEETWTDDTTYYDENVWYDESAWYDDSSYWYAEDAG